MAVGWGVVGLGIHAVGRMLPDPVQAQQSAELLLGALSRCPDPDMALAIVEMPAEFSGVLELDRNQLIDSALQAQHGEAMTQLVEFERAIEMPAQLDSARMTLEACDGILLVRLTEEARETEGKNNAR